MSVCLVLGCTVSLPPLSGISLFASLPSSMCQRVMLFSLLVSLSGAARDHSNIQVFFTVNLKENLIITIFFIKISWKKKKKPL